MFTSATTNPSDTLKNSPAMSNSSVLSARGIPLFTFDNTLTSSDDCDQEEVIEIPLSATEEILPYDPLTMKIRTEQQLMNRRHTQQKQIANKNMLSGRMDTNTNVNLYTSPNPKPMHLNTSLSQSAIERIETDDTVSRSTSSQIKSEDVNVGYCVGESVVVPNESITWKSGIVKRQKQDFEELGKLSGKSSSNCFSADCSPPQITSSSSMSILNSDAAAQFDCADLEPNANFTDTCLIVRSKSLKETSTAARSDDPFSNCVDRMFDREEKRSLRESCVTGSSGEGNPSRTNSWGSFDSAVVLGDRERDFPSRQSSWGSCDTRVTSATGPSRNNSFGNFDTRRVLEDSIPESRLMNISRVVSRDIPPQDQLESQQAHDQPHQCSKNNLSRICSFNGSGSQRLSDGLSTSFSSDQLCYRGISNRVSSARKTDDIHLFPALYKPKISSGDLKFDPCIGLEHEGYKAPTPVVITRRKVYKSPPFKILCTDDDMPKEHIGSQEAPAREPLKNNMETSPKRQTVHCSQVDISQVSAVLARNRSQSDVYSASEHPVADHQLTSCLGASKSEMFESDSSDSCQVSPVDCAPAPGTVKQQKNRLESWMYDTDSNKENKREHWNQNSSHMTTSSPNFSRSLSSCSMEFSSESPDGKSGGISRSLSEKRSKFESKNYGGRVRKLTRDLEKNVSPALRRSSQHRRFSAACRQRSHSLERLGGPATLTSPDASSSSQMMLDQLVLEAQAHARNLEQEAAEVSECSQESSEEVSVRNLVGIYEKPDILKKKSSDRRLSNIANKSSRAKSRPRSDSVGEKYLPPVPLRKSSLDYSLKTPLRSSSQPPQNDLPQLSRLGHSFAKNLNDSDHKDEVIRVGFSGKMSSPSRDEAPPPTTPYALLSGKTFPRPPKGSLKKDLSLLSGLSIEDANSIDASVGRTGHGMNSTDAFRERTGHGRNCTDAFTERTGHGRNSTDAFRERTGRGKSPSKNSTGESSRPKRKVFSTMTVAGSPALMTSSHSSPSLSSASSLLNNNGSSSHACSTELRQKKQQGKTHPLSRLPTRENGLH